MQTKAISHTFSNCQDCSHRTQGIVHQHFSIFSPTNLNLQYPITQVMIT